MKLAEKIYYYRKRMGISQEELAQRLGVTRQAVSKWEMGISQPELDTVVTMSKVFAVSLDTLLTEEETESKQENAASSKESWLDRLPGFVGKLFRRYGWIAGVYIAVGGAGMLGLGAMAKYLSEKMTSSFQETVAGITGMAGNMNMMVPGGIDGVFGGFEQQTESLIDSFTQFDPVGMVSTVIMVLGGLLAVGGTILALLLKKNAAGEKERRR